jgi:hypothetical protein
MARPAAEGEKIVECDVAASYFPFFDSAAWAQRGRGHGFFVPSTPPAPRRVLAPMGDKSCGGAVDCGPGAGCRKAADERPFAPRKREGGV